MTNLRAEEKESCIKKTEEENATTTTRARARLFGVDAYMARRLLMNANLLVIDAVAASKRIKGMTQDEVVGWIEYMDSVDYRFTDGKKVNRRNFRRSMRMYHMVENQLRSKQEAEARKAKENERVDYEALAKERAEAKRREKAKDPREWEMCKERCANCLEGGGCPAFRVPPQLREWPLNAEECPGFARRDDYHGC